MTERKICIAPMLDYTDRHCRYFLRQFSKHIFLYTEMITTGALLRGDAERFLAFHPQEHPLALQLGGIAPDDLIRCAKFAEQFHYDEINLNIGCPSKRVQSGQFGACLMLEPKLVAQAVAALQAQTKIPVTIKTRIGVDQHDSDEFLQNFLSIVSDSGVRVVILHARKALLKGLSPKQNRTIPPLNYQRVYRMKQLFPHLEIIINGGIKTVAEIHEHLRYVDGVMIGREACANPMLLAEIEQAFYNPKTPIATRADYFQRYLPYVQENLAQGERYQRLIKPVLGLMHGVSNARQLRQQLLLENLNLQF